LDLTQLSTACQGRVDAYEERIALISILAVSSTLTPLSNWWLSLNLCGRSIAGTRSTLGGRRAGGSMVELPFVPRWRVERVQRSGIAGLMIPARSCRDAAGCPDCRHRSTAVHGYYRRRTADLRGGAVFGCVRCSSHSAGIARVNSSSCIPFDCRPSRMASWISGASSVNHSSLLTKLRPIFSASAISCAERHLPASSSRFHRCALASARISVSSGRALMCAHASPPSGAMITFCPPRRLSNGNARMASVRQSSRAFAQASADQPAHPSGVSRSATVGSTARLSWRRIPLRKEYLS
jgi:hypothetical protein